MPADRSGPAAVRPTRNAPDSGAPRALFCTHPARRPRNSDALPLLLHTLFSETSTRALMVAIGSRISFIWGWALTRLVHRQPFRASPILLPSDEMRRLRSRRWRAWRGWGGVPLEPHRDVFRCARNVWTRPAQRPIPWTDAR